MAFRKEITFAGVGGQGLLSAGNILCLSAVTYAGINATMSAEYGSETRGTFAKSDVILSDEKIFFPEIEIPSLVVALDPIAYRRYCTIQDPNPVVIYDADLIQPVEDVPFQQVGIHFTDESRKAGNLPINMLALGYVVSMTGIISESHVQNALIQLYGNREKVLRSNAEGFLLGMNLFHK